MAAWLVPTQLVRVQVLGGVLLSEPFLSTSTQRSTGGCGCDSGWVHSTTQSRGPTATTLGSHPGNDGSIPSGTTLMETACPDTPTGRAARLKPECLQVRLLLWVLMRQWLGRQLVDHLGLEPGMLWVRLPPEPLANNYVLAEQRSARLPVTQEIVGSNPIGDAFSIRTRNGD